METLGRLWTTCIVLFCFAYYLCSCGRDAGSGDEQYVEIPDQIDFNFHVRPILSDRCYACHGPDEKARESGLRLDMEASAFAPIDSLDERYAIVPGKPDQSVLIQRVESLDPEMVMPPPASNLELAPYEIEILRRWIKQGAEWKSHWAFIPPKKEEPSPTTEENPIDFFVRQALKQRGLKPSPEATREKLIRRLSFDLRGLPPSIPELDQYLNDDSKDAYERVVDRFLAQSSFGERMAMEWMDLARYADSHGYQDDLERSMWPWRDWVIEAFNQNMPYDQFVTWQLAGDLLPDATYEQKLATGFNRNHKITQEVGVINEEYRTTYVLDRVNTFSTAFLGMTLECAQCHDHKFDPVSQEEYYQLFSFFNNVPEKGRVDYGVEVAEPYLPLPDEKVEELRKYVDTLLSQQKEKVASYAVDRWPDFSQAEDATAPVHAPQSLRVTPVNYFPLDHVEEDEFIDLATGSHGQVVYDGLPVVGKRSGALEFVGTNYTHITPGRTLNFNRPFTVSFWIKSLDGGIRGSALAAMSSAGQRIFNVRITNQKTVRIYLGDERKSQEIQFVSKEEIPENRWVHLAVVYDGSRRSQGLTLYLDGKPVNKYPEGDDLRGTVPRAPTYIIGAAQHLKFRSDQADQRTYFFGEAKGLQAGQLDEIALFDRQLGVDQLKVLAEIDPISLLHDRKMAGELSKRRFYDHLHQDDAEYQQLVNWLREYKIRQMRTDDIVVKPTMVMSELDTARIAYVLDRGQYDAPTTPVQPGTPAALFAWDTTRYTGDRLGLAQWLFDEQHPLTARVAVNRYWQMIFGSGLVSTPGDFGSQGTLPSHPALLDWLAVEFRASNWDVKALLKQMVMSHTYRQEVKGNKRSRRLDPSNTWLARGPQSRLSAEMVRDHALAISGLMGTRTGGPSVKPYQPEGLWLEVASGNQALRKYIQDHGADLYRRSLYTFWKRTIPPPSMMVFDAPSREQCTVQRRPTSTPMQALVLLNDPQFAEASRLIAARMVAEGGSTLEERIAFAFRLATSRSPKDQEVQLLVRLYEDQRTSFAEDLTSAAALLQVGEFQVAVGEPAAELAAYTVIANTILNVTESIMKS